MPTYSFDNIFDGPSLIPLPEQQEQRGSARLEDVTGNRGGSSSGSVSVSSGDVHHQAPQNSVFDPQERSIWVGSLEPRATAQQVRFAFSVFGDITHVGNPTVDRSTFQRAWTIIDFAEAKAAQRAVRIYSNDITSRIAHSMKHIQDVVAGEWPCAKLQVRPKTRRERSAAANAAVQLGQLIPETPSLAAGAAPLQPSVQTT
ncbi:hypothetical protein COCOBI_08-6160 [Coccomyxa sp. Obi]|nr:hypothetical protein COCOBI_08-6160 [Coccomyxa sp. Obi]